MRSMADTKVVRVDEDILPLIRRYSDGSISDGVRAMQKIIVENSIRVITPEEVVETVRKVCQVEGVVLKRFGDTVPEQPVQSGPAAPGVSLEQVEGAVRQVTQKEGIMLHSQQKQFFREIFASLTQCISDKGLMS